MDAIYQKVSKYKLCLYCAFFFFFKQGMGIIFNNNE